jgi:hypothetical protein
MSTVQNDRLAFIHVPKTGGSWVTEAMRVAGVECRPAKNRFGGERFGHLNYLEVPADRFRFGFVRKPAEWYLSFWCHRHTYQDWQPEGTMELDDLARGPFPQFIERVTTELPGYLERLYEHYLGPRGEIEFVGRYENLREDLIHALSRAGDYDLDAVRQLEPVNTSRRLAELTPELSELVLEAERGVTERFYPQTLG